MSQALRFMISRRFFGPATVAAVVFVLYAAFAFQLYRNRQHDISRFVVAGHSFTDPASTGRCLSVDLQSAGYDGQFFYRLAVNPFSTAPRVAGVRFDYPVYRHQRLLYPLLASALSLGRPCAVIWVLVLLNIAAVVTIGVLATVLVRDAGVGFLWGVVPALAPVFLLSVARDLAEPVMLAFLLGGFLAILRDRWSTGVVLLTLATLTKETALVGIAAAFLTVMWRSLRDRRLVRLALALLVPPAVFLAWKNLLFFLWETPSGGWANVFAPPLRGWAAVMEASLRSGTRIGFVQMVELLALMLLALMIAAALWQSRAAIEMRVACATYGIFVFALNEGIWVEDWAFLRAAAEFVCLGAIVGISSGRITRMAFGAFYITAWLLLAREVAFFR